MSTYNNVLKLKSFHETKDISPIKLIYLNSTSSMLITGHKNYIIKVYDVDKLNLINQFRVQVSNLSSFKKIIYFLKIIFLEIKES